MQTSIKAQGIRGLLLIICVSLLTLSSWHLIPRIQTRVGVYLMPPQIQYFSFGYKEVIADSLWIRSIQDFDYCSQLVNKRDCVGKSWLYQMLHLISELSPHWRAIYAIGGIALSVIVSDQEGASLIFDKGEIEFPNDWPIMYRAAYQALIEEKNPQKAARRLELAAKAGAPSWCYHLAAKMYTQAGEYEMIERLYQELSSQENIDKSLLEKLEQRLKDRKK